MKSIHTISHAPAHLAKSNRPTRGERSGNVTMRVRAGACILRFGLFPFVLKSDLASAARYRSAQGNGYGVSTAISISGCAGPRTACKSVCVSDTTRHHRLKQAIRPHTRQTTHTAHRPPVGERRGGRSARGHGTTRCRSGSRPPQSYLSGSMRARVVGFESAQLVARVHHSPHTKARNGAGGACTLHCAPRVTKPGRPRPPLPSSPALLA